MLDAHATCAAHNNAIFITKGHKAEGELGAEQMAEILDP